MSEDDDEKFEGVDELFQANMHCDDNIPPLAFAWNSLRKNTLASSDHGGGR